MKRLSDFTLDEFVDKLVSWINNKETNAPFKRNLNENGVKMENLIPALLQPIIAASNYAESDNSIFEYCNKRTVLKDIKSRLTQKASEFKIPDVQLHESILKKFTYRLVINSCSLKLDDVSDNSTGGLRILFPQRNLTKLAETIRKSGATTVGAAIKVLSDKMKKTDIPDGLNTTARTLFPNKENVTIKEIYDKLVDILFDNEVYTEAPKMNERNYKKYKEEVSDSIKNGARQIILTGAPGTGKTKMVKDIADTLGTALSDKPAKYEFVQFHPSYDYTDFVEGLRPVEDNGKIVFKRIDGIFKDFCRKVEEENKKNEENEQRKYFFLIDEINRADLSKVFGELMYCLESDKRGEENTVKTPYHNLKTYLPNEKDDVFVNGFYIPQNVYIIGTMNDIDRSVESMDFALRRRFMFMEIEVTEALLEGAFERADFWRKSDQNVSKNKSAEDIDKKVKCLVDGTNPRDLAQRVMAMNKVMDAPAYKDFGLNKDYYISQGQFANLPDNAFGEDTNDTDAVKSVVDFVWQWRIKLLLREYVRGEDNVEAFIKACEDALKKPVKDQNPSKDAANSAEAKNGAS